MGRARSVSMSGRGNHFYGKKHTLESLAIISAVSRARIDSEKTRLRKSLASMGRKQSVETRKKRSELMSGERNPMYARRWPDEARKRMSQRNCGSHNPFYGKRHTVDTIKKFSGANCNFWKGGISTINARLRVSAAYKKWRTAVFERDNYTCVFCGDNRGGNLNADHIKPFQQEQIYP